MLVQQGVGPVRTIVFEGALGFAAAEPRAILIRLLGGLIACDAFPVPIEVNEIAQGSLPSQPPPAKRRALLPRECGALRLGE